MQPLDVELMDCECSRNIAGVGIWGKNLNFEKRLTWTIWKSDGKLVLVNAVARWRAWSFIDLGEEFEFSERTDVVREASTRFWVQPLDEARART